MSPENEKKAEAWWEQKTKDTNCPVCHHRLWHWGELMVAPVPPEPLKRYEVATTTEVVLFAPLVCENCSYTLLFRARDMGIGSESPTSK